MLVPGLRGDLREAEVLDHLGVWLVRVFAPGQRERTVRVLADQGPDASASMAEAARRKLAECDRKLAQHRAELEAGVDPALVAQWIAETQTQRAAGQAHLRQAHGRRRMSKAEINMVITALGDLVAVLRAADVADKADLYSKIGLKLPYRPQKRLVEAQVVPGLHICVRCVSEGGLEPPCP